MKEIETNDAERAERTDAKTPERPREKPRDNAEGTWANLIRVRKIAKGG
ncbi:MAG: hypothetical protein ABL955_01550 [Elusimicrobiota bacterium]